MKSVILIVFLALRLDSAAYAQTPFSVDTSAIYVSTATQSVGIGLTTPAGLFEVGAQALQVGDTSGDQYIGVGGGGDSSVSDWPATQLDIGDGEDDDYDSAFIEGWSNYSMNGGYCGNWPWDGYWCLGYSSSTINMLALKNVSSRTGIISTTQNIGLFMPGNLLVGGSAGIGTTNPQNALDVNGGMAIGSYAGNNSAPSKGLIVSGNVGIGTTSPGASLGVSGSIYSNVTGENNFALNSSGADFGFILNNSANVWSLGYGTNIGTLGTSVLTWNSSGNVGIGTTSPGQILDVNGYVNAANGFCISESCITSFSFTNYWTLSGNNIINNNSGTVQISSPIISGRASFLGTQNNSGFEIMVESEDVVNVTTFSFSVPLLSSTSYRVTWNAYLGTANAGAFAILFNSNTSNHYNGDVNGPDNEGSGTNNYCGVLGPSNESAMEANNQGSGYIDTEYRTGRPTMNWQTSAVPSAAPSSRDSMSGVWQLAVNGAGLSGITFVFNNGCLSSPTNFSNSISGHFELWQGIIHP